jgi:serine/threonine protein kinase
MQGDFSVEGYDIEGLLGAGPAGEVWLAREQASGALVALKRVRPRDADAQDGARRVLAALDAIRHPNLARIHQLIPRGDEFVFVVDYAEGGSIGQLLLVRGSLDPGEVVTMAGGVARALAALHERGVAHGDVTPENILLAADATPLLADVGLLDLVEDGGGPAGGTFGYADPARKPGEPATPAGDIYGLAAVCYTALTGTPPEPGPARRPLLQLAPGVPPPLAHVVEAGLQPRPEQRPGATQFAAQVEAAAAAVPIRFPVPSGDLLAPPGPSTPEQGASTGPSVTAPPAPAQPGPAPAPQPPDAPHSGVRPAEAFVSSAPMPSPPLPSTAARPPAPPAEDEDDDGDRGRRTGRLVALLVGVPVALALLATVAVLGWQTLAKPASRGTPEPTTIPTARPTSPPTQEPTQPSPGSPTASPRWTPRTAAEARWTRVLTELDRRRTKAWLDLDRDQLRRIYKPGSVVLQEELANMEEHAAKNVTSVVGLNTPILSLKVLSESEERVVVEAVSQLQPYSLKIGDRLYPHEGGEPRRFRMTLEPDESGEWLIAANEEVGAAG